MNDLQHAVLAAYSVIDEILTDGGEILYSKYIGELSRPFSLTSTTDLIICSVECGFIRREIINEERWNEDVEFEPCSIDTWARNAIPTRLRFVSPQPEPVLVQASDTKSMKSFKSGRSTRSALGARNNKRVTIGSSKLSVAIGETPLPFPMPAPVVILTEEEENLRTKKENELKRKFDEAERMKKINNEMEEQEKKLRKEANDMKNKPITYTCSGSIMYVNHPKYDSIPKLLTEAVLVTNEKKSELPPLAVKKKKKFDDLRMKTAPAREQDWVRNMTALGPSLYEIIKLNPGVTLTDGPKTKYPQITQSASQKTLTRREYLNHSNSYKSLNPPLVLPEKQFSGNSSQDNYKNSSKMSSKRDFLEEIPEYDGVDLLQESEELDLPVKISHSKDRIKMYGQNSPINDDNPIEKFNAEIKLNKQWGRNPTYKKPLIIENIAKKPSSAGMKDIYGDLLKKPKDQPFISVEELWKSKGNKIKKPRDRPFIEKVQKKSRQPAPPYGFTMINALPDYEEWLKFNSDVTNKK